MGLQRVGGFLRTLRLFLYEHQTFVEIAFIVLYGIEQISLILSTYFFKENIELLVSLFAVMVLSTFASHKAIMESRIKLQEEEINNLELEKRIVQLQARMYVDYFDEKMKSFKYSKKS